MDISVIIVSYNTKKLLKECIESVLNFTKGLSYEIIIVDNNSKDGSIKYLKDLSRKFVKVKTIFNVTNVGFGKANNLGAKIAKSRYVLFLNSDTKVNGNVLGEMANWLDNNVDIGIASCAILNPDRSMQGTGGYFPNLLKVFLWMFFIEDIPFLSARIKSFHPIPGKLYGFKGKTYFNKIRELDWVTGAFLLIRKKVLDKIEGFDESYFMYTEETDLCFRTKKLGWKVVYNPNWEIIHYGGASGHNWSYVTAEFNGVKLFYRKHYPIWQSYVLRLFLKGGAFIRIFLYLLTNGKEASKAYAEAFVKA